MAGRKEGVDHATPQLMRGDQPLRFEFGVRVPAGGLSHQSDLRPRPQLNHSHVTLYEAVISNLGKSNLN
jgi:hypothetical protein